MLKFVRVFIPFLLLLSSDQFIKYLVISQDFNYYKNYGFLFGLVNFRNPVISVLVICTILILVMLNLPRRQAGSFQHLNGSRNKFGMTWAVGWSLFLAGSVSNIFDRVSRGYVVDFLDWKTILPFWPAGFVRFFNLADVFIVVGLILIVCLRRSGGRDCRNLPEPF